MNLRWLLLDYVDRELPLSGTERRRLWWRALDIMHTRPAPPRDSRPSKWLFAAYALAPSVSIFLPQFIAMRIRVPIWGLAILFVIGMAMLWITMTWLGQFTWRPAIVAALREAGHDLCERCGYWLRGLGHEVLRCPECGANRPFHTPSLMQTSADKSKLPEVRHD